MKKVLLTILMAICVLCFTGCIRFNTTVQVKSNGKADVSMLYAMQSEDGTDTDSGSVADSFDELKSEGWEVEEYHEDDYYGVKCTKKNLDFNDISNQMGDTEDATGIMDSSAFKVTKKGMTYTFDWDLGDSEQDTESDEFTKSIKEGGGYMTFTLKVPMKAKSSNATNVSDGGKTLEWDLLDNKGEGIHAEFTLINWPLIICIILAVIIVLLLKVMIFLQINIDLL